MLQKYPRQDPGSAARLPAFLSSISGACITRPGARGDLSHRSDLFNQREELRIGYFNFSHRHEPNSFSLLATRSLFLPRREGQRSALLFLPWDSSERCRGVCKDLYRQLCIQSWTTHVWEETREVTTGKGGKPRVLPIHFATSGHSDPLQMAWPKRYPADTWLSGKLSS